MRASVQADGVVRVVLGSPRDRPWAVPRKIPVEEAGSGIASGSLSIEERDGALTVRVAGELLVDGARFSDENGTRTLSWTPPVDERFVGTGERTGPLQRRGRVHTFRTTDAFDPTFMGYAPEGEPLYQAIPLLMGLHHTQAYGLFVDVTHTMRWDLASAGRVVLSTEGPGFDLYVIAGPTPADVVTRYTALTGRIALPPRWALGYHQCRWGWFPDTTVVDVMDQFRARNLPADGIWLDIQHMDDFRSFTWHPEGFADPRKFTSDAHARGFKVVTIIDPGIKLDEHWGVCREALDDKHVLREPDGRPFVGKVWPGASVFPDFSSSRTRAWWGAQLKRLTDVGVDGVWIDMNEPSSFKDEGGPGTVPDSVVTEDSTMAEVHNVYGLCMAQATRDGLEKAQPGTRPFILTRAGYAGIQRHAAVWTGDAPSRWDVLRDTLPMMLNMGLSGVPFIGSDVGGFSGDASPEMFVRWMQLGVVSPFFRGHVTATAKQQEPWQFGTEAEDICRAMLELRYRLLPHLASLFVASSRTGEPILRPMLFDFPSESALFDVDDQAMLGPWLLCAPVLTEGARSRSVRLPAGRWLELSTLQVHEGPAVIDVAAPLDALPLFLREGAVIAEGPRVSSTSERVDGPIVMRVFPSEKRVSVTHFDDDGTSVREVHITTQRVGDTILLESDAPFAWRIHSEKRPTLVELNGQPSAFTWSGGVVSLPGVPGPITA